MSYYASGLPMLSNTGYNVYSEVDAYRAQVAYLGETYFLIPLQETGEVPSFFLEAYNNISSAKSIRDKTPKIVNSIIIYDKALKKYKHVYPPKGIKKKVWNTK